MGCCCSSSSSSSVARVARLVILAQGERAIASGDSGGDGALSLYSIKTRSASSSSFSLDIYK